MKRKYCLLAILWPVLNAIAQPPPPHALTIGDPVPDIFFDSLMNYKSATAHLSDFRGRLVILDLWSSFCAPCLALFPHLDTLQRKYKDDIQVLLVNAKSELLEDDAAKIKRVIEKLEKRTGTSIGLPVIHHNKELDAYFPATSFPHEVWIDREGKVLAITEANELTNENIEAVLSGKKTTMRLKKEDTDFDSALPLFTNGNGGNGEEMKFRSLLTGYIEGIGGAIGLDTKDGKIVRCYLRNQTLFSLVKQAYNSIITYSDNRLIIVSDNKGFAVDHTDPAFYDNAYCYELLLPPTNDATLRRYMQEDLRRYFNIRAYTEERTVKCLVLERLPHSLLKKDEQEQAIDLGKASLKKYIHHYPPSFIVNLLNQYSSLPIIDQTGMEDTVSVDLPYNLHDIQKLKDAFYKAGFRLKEDYRPLKVIVITDK